ncbi:MAG: hypothetical protein EZS28_047973, partial [Streblomastix strix]
LRGLNNDNNRVFRNVTLELIALHSFDVVALTVCCALYYILAQVQSQRFENLKQICQLTSLQAHLAPLFIGCLYQDLVCAFNYTGITDGEAEFLITWDQICEKLLSYSDQITQTLENIYSIMADTDVWEDYNIIVQVFDIRLDLEQSEYSSSTQSSSKSFFNLTHDEPIQYTNKEQSNQSTY